MGENILSNQINPFNYSEINNVSRIPVTTRTDFPSSGIQKYLNVTSDCDYFAQKKPGITPAEKYYYKTYNQIWKQTGLPKELMPKAVFTDLTDAKIAFGYSFEAAKVIIPKSENNLEHITFQNMEKHLLAHECQHVKQGLNIARLYGSEGLKEVLIKRAQTDEKRQCIEKTFNKKFYDKAIRIMGKIDINSAEGKEAEKWAKALSEYKTPIYAFEEYKKASSLGKLKIYAKYKKACRNYTHNPLEIDANKAAKRFKPSAVKNALKTITYSALGVCLTVVDAIKKKRVKTYPTYI